jgi:hypothetical protein
MKPKRHLSKLSTAAVAGGLGSLIVLGALLAARADFGQGQAPGEPPAQENGVTPEVRSLVDDWTTHHLVFPDTTDNAVLARLQHDPRYWIQLFARQAHGPNASNRFQPFPNFGVYASTLPPLLGHPPKDIHAPWGFSPANSSNGKGNGNTSCHGPDCPVVDWSQALGVSNGANLNDGMFPAKFNFSTTGAPTCVTPAPSPGVIPDFVVFPVNTPGVAGAFATGAGTVTGAGTAGQQVTVDAVTLTAAGSLASETGTFTSTAISGGQTATVTDAGGSITLTASAPTSASNTGNFSSLLAPTSFTTFTNANSITIGNTSPANTLTLKTDATAAHETGSFSSAPFSTTSLTITNSTNSNPLTLTTSATTAQAIGTFSGAPLTVTNTPSLTITNSAVSPSNVLNLTTSAVAANATGTFSAGYCAQNGQGVAITNGATTLNLTVSGATAPTGSIAFSTSSAPAASSTIAIAATAGFATQTYTFVTSLTGAANEVLIPGGSWDSTHAITMATHLSEAINAGANAGTDYGTGTAANTVVTSSNGGTRTVSLTARCLGDEYDITLTPGGTTHTTTSTALASSNGSNTLTNFALSSTLDTVALDLAAAIHRNTGTVGVDSTSTTNPIAASATTLGTAGNSITVAQSFTSGFAWTFNSLSTTTLGGGNDGTDTCTGLVTPFTAHFATSGTSGGLASNVADAIGMCNAGIGVTATFAGSTVKVVQTKPGAFLAVSGSSSIFSWGTVTDSGGTNPPTNGLTSCDNTTGKFTTANTTTALATNLAAAINACTSATTGVTASGSGSIVTVLDTTLGNFNTFTVGGGDTTFSWGNSSTVTAGTNGSANTCTTNTTANFLVDSTTSGLATNLKNAIAACATPATVGVIASTTGTPTVTVTAATAGTTANATTLGSTITGYTWAAATLGAAPGTAGTNGDNTGTNFVFWGGSAYSSTTAATNLAAAITRTANGSGGAVPVVASVASSTVTVTADDPPPTGPATFTLSNSFASGSMTGFNAISSTGSTGTQDSTHFAISALTATEASNLATTINANATLQSASGVTASTGGTSTVTVTANTAGSAGNSITLVDNTLSNFTWTGQSGNPPTVNLAGGVTGQPSIMAFNNLYSGTCTGTVPMVVWAYRTTSSPIATSPVLSIDGTQVAYVENSNPPKFHVLTVGTTGSNGSITGPVVPCTINGTTSCTTNNAADTAVSFGATGDAISSPFPDYNTNSAYVAAADGKLYKFTTVFGNGNTPTLAAGWPLTVSATNLTLTSPVLDVFTGRIFIGDSGGFVHLVRTATGDNCTGSVAPPCVDSTTQTTAANGLDDGPIVDITNQSVFAFNGGKSNGSPPYTVTQAREPAATGLAWVTTTQSTAWAATHAYSVGTLILDSNSNVEECTTAGTSGGSHPTWSTALGGTTPDSGTLVWTNMGPNPVTVSPATKGTNGKAHLGTFDNNYFTTPSTGRLYVCGPDSSTNPTLYGFTFTGTIPVMNSSPSTLALSTQNSALCSPVTEFVNGTHDWLFLGVGAKCNAGPAGGCVLDFDVASGFPGSPHGFLAETAGTSGIVIDNSSTATGASNIYFSTNPGIANAVGDGIQLTQAQ